MEGLKKKMKEEDWSAAKVVEYRPKEHTLGVLKAKGKNNQQVSMECEDSEVLISGTCTATTSGVHAFRSWPGGGDKEWLCNFTNVLDEEVSGEIVGVGVYCLKK